MFVYENVAYVNVKLEQYLGFVIVSISHHNKSMTWRMFDKTKHEVKNFEIKYIYSVLLVNSPWPLWGTINIMYNQKYSTMLLVNFGFLVLFSTSPAPLVCATQLVFCSAGLPQAS